MIFRTALLSRAKCHGGFAASLAGLVLANLTLLTVPAAAQDATRLANQRQLQLLSQAMQQTVARTDSLKQEVSALSADRAELNRRLIDTAAQIKDSEAQISAAEDRLNRLSDREIILRGSLKAQRETLAELIGALQKIGQKPPPALVVKPEDALAAIRSAIVLGAIVPELRDEARKLTNDLAELVTLRDNIKIEQQRLTRSTAILTEAQIRIGALLDSKRSTLAATQAELIEARRKAETLARETNSLKELIARMDAEISPPAVESGGAPGDPDAKPLQVALNDPGRIKPAVDFGSATGLLPLPVRGQTLTRFGEADALGNISRGISMATRTGAQVTSPADGWIVYAGKFRSYGQLLILNAGEGYHVVLAGLDKINVEPGQFVLAGEPIGIMGTGTAPSQSFVVGGPSDRPILYVEFRKDGNSIDPSPWWASAEEKVRG